MRAGRWVVVAVVIVASLTPIHAQDVWTLSRPAMEAFLRSADLSDFRDAGEGVTRSRRATATDGALAEDVHVQIVDQHPPGFVAAGTAAALSFRDSYLYNVAAYRIAELLDIDSVPPSVIRYVSGRPAAVTLWVEDVAMTERERLRQGTLGPNPAQAYEQYYTMYVLDELIRNDDRNQGNMLWTTDWDLWLIDHTRAFRLEAELRQPELLTRIRRDLLGHLRGLTPEALEEVTEDTLTRAQRSRILARRDLLMRHFEDRIERFGERSVIID